MTTQRWMHSSAIAAPLSIALLLLASSCGQSTSSAKLPTPSAAPSPTPAAASPTPPPGGPVPAQLLGDWFLPQAATTAFFGAHTGEECPSDASASNCFVQLTLTAASYQQMYTAGGGARNLGSGNVVVSNNEIDFFNEVNPDGITDCAIRGGVGRYKWTLTGGVLLFTLISEPCSGTAVLAYKGWRRTH
jgi:hypothetical protein